MIWMMNNEDNINITRQAYREGCYAFENGKRYRDNPYIIKNEDGSIEHKNIMLALFWDNGYTESMIEHERNQQ